VQWTYTPCPSARKTFAKSVVGAVVALIDWLPLEIGVALEHPLAPRAVPTTHVMMKTAETAGLEAGRNPADRRWPRLATLRQSRSRERNGLRSLSPAGSHDVFAIGRMIVCWGDSDGVT
jgi:hypothetical protein